MESSKKYVRFSLTLILSAFAFIAAYFPVNAMEVRNASNDAQSESIKDKQVSIEPTVSHIPSNIVKPSDVPTEEPISTETPKPTYVSKPTKFPKPTKTPKPLSKLKKVDGVKLVRYSTNTIKVTWKKGNKANYYRVYCSKKKSGAYRLAGVTRKTRLLVTKLKKNRTYYFYVQACRKKNIASSDSGPSKKVHIKIKNYSRKIIFAGDSITEGIGYPGLSYPYMNIKAKKQTVAYRGLNTVTFHTKRLFDGRTGLQKLISEKPYRVYMMLGLNEIHYKPVSDVIAEYKEMIIAIQQSCPTTDIVICAVSPVTREEKERCPGFSQIPLYNKKLKKLAKKTDTTYFDYTSFLKDSEGYLKEKYAASDGYHWKTPAYAEFGKLVGKFDKSLDK